MFSKKSIFVLILCAAMLQMTGCGGLIEANFLISQEKYDEAIPILKQEIAQEPDAIEARSKLGYAYLKTGQLDKAIREFKIVLKKKPGDPCAILYLGMAYLNKEELGRAIEALQQYRNESAPLVEEEINRLMTVLMMAQSQRAARKALEQEAQLKTRRPEANTIAVCYFDDLSTDKSLRAYQKGLAAMIITDLSKIKGFKVVERLRIQALLQEMKLGQTGIVDPATAPRVGRLLGSEHLLTGNLSLGSIRAVTALSSASSNTVVGSASAQVDEDNFYSLPGQVVQNCANILGVSLTDEQKAAIGVPHTTVFKAFVSYGKALDALDAGQWQVAKNFFSQAVAADPDFDLARMGLETCPGADTPSLSAISSMSVSDLSNMVGISVSAAESEQEAMDSQEASDQGGDGGGDGGGAY